MSVSSRRRRAVAPITCLLLFVFGSTAAQAVDWTSMTSGTTNLLNGVWGNSESNVFAVGSLGTILHYDGSSWSAMSSGTTNVMYCVWGTSGNNVFAVGDFGTILHSDGSSWSAMSSGTTSRLWAVWGSSESNVFAVGNAGTILHYDGSSWSAMSSGTTRALIAVWGSSGSNVFAVGSAGTILHYDGTSWSAMTSGTTNNLYWVWGSSGSNVFAVGNAGTILHYGTQGTVSWVALGDSYSSGEGAGDFGQTDDPANNYCHRSANVWSGPGPGGGLSGPANAVFPDADRQLFACSGAKATNLRQIQTFEGGGWEAPQLDHPEVAAADFVTLTMGGNDAGFADVLWECIRTFSGDCTSSDFVPPGFSTSLIAWVQQNIEALDAPANSRPSIRWALTEVLGEVALGTPVVLLGYPYLFDTDTPPNGNCAGNLSGSEALFWNTVTDELNARLCLAASELGVYFVPVVEEFRDHGTCQASSWGDPSWINHVVFSDPRQSFHPNRLGQAAYARVLRGFLPQGGTSGQLPHMPASFTCPVAAPRVSSPSTVVLNTTGSLSVTAAVNGCAQGGKGFAPGQTVTVMGAEFAPAVSVAVWFTAEGSLSQQLGTLTANASGSVSGSVTIPVGAPQNTPALMKATGPNSDGGLHALYAPVQLFPSTAADEDFDGVPDLCDNCLSASNGSQTDADNDGVGDACDSCPTDSDNDSDGDGLCADSDPCPLDPLNDQDADGLCADADFCPSVPIASCFDADGFEAGSACAWSAAVGGGCP